MRIRRRRAFITYKISTPLSLFLYQQVGENKKDIYIYFTLIKVKVKNYLL